LVARKKHGGYYPVPLARYFFVVGSLLLAVIFVADWYLPDAAQTVFRDGQIDKSIVRIKSAHKWPEPIVIDTSLPTIVPPRPPVLASAPLVSQPREAFAQLDAPAQPVAKGAAATASKPKLAKKVTHTRIAAYRESPQAWTPEVSTREVSAREVLPAGW
jgi:hypothetical protein